MEFFVIMGIGTLVAILIVAGLPKSGHLHIDESVFSGKKTGTPIWKKDIVETYANGDLEYLEKLERHQKDPQHWPCPFPPDKQPKA
ncbi:MAG TPA: hypothetical protein VGY56_07045 [Verrucomicrobiae bacterium]|nr:hypothetical protein [Verrucomicrobiae bacterium]